MNLATLCDSYVCEAEIGTNCCHLAVFSFEREFSQHKVALHHPLPYVSACGINYASEKVSNMLSNSAYRRRSRSGWSGFGWTTFIQGKNKISFLQKASNEQKC